MSTKQIAICDGCGESLEGEIKVRNGGVVSYTYCANTGEKVGKYDLCSRCYTTILNLNLKDFLKTYVQQ